MSRLCARLSSSLSLIASVLFLLAGFAAPAARAQYTAPIDIPLPQSTAVVSKLGTVAGSALAGAPGPGQNQCLFIWTPQNGATVFNCEPAFFGAANGYTVLGVNNSGTILVIDNNDGASYFTATASGGEVQLQLPAGGNPSTEPYSGDQIFATSMAPVAIDDNGNVVGYSNVYDNTSQTTYNEAVIWPAGGTPIFLGPFTPSAINDAGQVAGSDSNGNGWVWTQNGGPLNIGQLTPTSENSSGQITGTLPNGDIFLWSSGTGAVDLGPNPAIPTPLLNDVGVIVGSFPISIFNLSGVQAESWTSNNGFQQMQSLDGAGPGGLNTDTPAAINAVSQVVGQGYFYNGGQQAEYWANLTVQTLALGAGQINAISDNGLAVGIDYTTGYAAVWNLGSTVIGASQVPVPTITTPGNNASYSVNQSVTTSFTCSSPDGIASCTAQDDQGNQYTSGQQLVTTNKDSAAMFTVTATSNAGVTSSTSVNYTINSGGGGTSITGAKMRGYGALAADQQGDLYRFTMDVEDTQNGTQAGRFDLWTVDKSGNPSVTNSFDADSITSVNFTNTGLLGTNKKGQLLADTVTFTGTGEFNDVAGYTFTATATDAGQPGVGKDTLNVTVTDPNNNVAFSAMGLLDAGDIHSSLLGATPPPVFTDGPPPVTQLEATGPGGAVATFDAPVAVDYNGNPVPATCTPASGSTFTLGVTHGTCTTAATTIGSSSSGAGAGKVTGKSAIRFRVIVKDTTPPVISNVPQNITVPATSPSGAVVTYRPPTATDTVDPSPSVSCTPPSGSTFAIATTTVVCTAKDFSGNTSQTTFTVTVKAVPVAPTVRWANPPSIVYGTPTGVAQQTAVVTGVGGVSLPATLFYTQPSGVVLKVGTYPLGLAVIPNDSVDYYPVSAYAYLTVTPANPVVTWANPAAITYGTPLSVTQLDATANVPGSFFYTSPAGLNPAGTLLPAGVSPLGAGFTPTDSTDYNPISAYVVISVNKATTTTTIAVTTSQTITGTAATITATVKPQIGGTPTGTVTYYNGSTVLGSAAVGKSFTTGVLPVGTDQIKAAYSGDSNFVGSTSSATAVTCKH